MVQVLGLGQVSLRVRSQFLGRKQETPRRSARNSARCLQGSTVTEAGPKGWESFVVRPGLEPQRRRTSPHGRSRSAAPGSVARRNQWLLSSFPGPGTLSFEGNPSPCTPSPSRRPVVGPRRRSGVEGWIVISANQLLEAEAGKARVRGGDRSRNKLSWK